MASLALLVAIIFLITLLIGPLALLAKYFKLKLISQILGVLAIFTGIYWLTVAIFPISMIGLIGIICGINTFHTVSMKDKNISELKSQNSVKSKYEETNLKD